MPAPLNKDNRPDLYNYMPSRMVSLEEAARMNWNLFYIATPCKYGHLAPRYVKNPRICVDCKRWDAGKPYIGGKAVGDWPVQGGRISNKSRLKMQLAARRANVGRVVHEKVREPEPENFEKRILDSYGATKSLAQTAKLLDIPEGQIEARISYSTVFRDAVESLEKRLGIRRKVSPLNSFDWTDEVRNKLIEVFVDTGDLATARDSIEVTPSEFFRELDRNQSFAERIQEATPLAARALEERAIQLALAGNDKLLTKVLAAKMPEYRDRVSVDMEVAHTLTESQLNARLNRLIGKLRPVLPIIEGQVAIIKDIRGASEEEGTSEDRPVLRIGNDKGTIS